MQVTVILHSVLREKLSQELKGKTILEFSEGATVIDAMRHFDLSKEICVALNDEVLHEQDHPLADGDMLRFFRLAGGG